MSTTDVAEGERPIWHALALNGAFRAIAIAVAIFAVAFMGYYLSQYLADKDFPASGSVWAKVSGGWCQNDTTSRDCWYKHYVYQAQAMLHGTLDLKEAGVPDYYQDLVRTPEGEAFLPYQPAPAIIMLPFVAIWGTDFSELYFSMIIGAINVALFWYVLRLLGVSRLTKLLLLPFFAFGTVNFYSASTGTLWFYNHVVAVMFLLLAIIFLLRRANPLLPAFFLGAAFMSRQPMILALPFFLYWMVRQTYPRVFTLETLRQVMRDREMLVKAGMFCAALVPFVGLSLWYNAARFGGVFDTGLSQLYDTYGGVPYSFYLNKNFCLLRDCASLPSPTRFDTFDLRNIPLHLYTIFLLPPQFVGGRDVFQPSWFGMSVLLTSPAFIFAALVKRDNPLKVACWLAIPLVAIPTLLYYSQGWVQFGYRYLMDYIPFLLMLTALGFEDHQSPTATKWKVALVAVSVIAGFWGRYWGTQLGW